MDVTVVAPGDGTRLDQRTARLADDVMVALGVEPGDAVAVGGDDGTVVRAEPAGDDAPDRTVTLTETDRENAGVAVQGAATVERVALPTAESVTVRLADRIDLRGGTDAVERVLRDAPVSIGDACSVSVLGGSVTLSFVVAEVTPESPALVGADTTVSVRGRGSDDRPGAGAGAGADADVGASAAVREEPSNSVTYDEVGGLDDRLQAVRQLVQLPLERAGLRESVGTATGGVLVYGPSGVGKTRLARAVGTETNAGYLEVAPGGAFDDGSLDVEGIRRAVAGSTPAVVFFDDLDALAPAASGGGSRERSTAALARLLDDFVSRPDVAVLGATTDPDAVHESLRRGGRFDHEVELPTPDAAGRAEILRVLLAEVPSERIDLDWVSGRTRGFVGADLRALVSAAVRVAVDHRVPGPDRDPARPGVELTIVDFRDALETVEPSGLRAVEIEQPSLDYRDVGGLDDVKRELVRAVEWPLQYPELFERIRGEAPSGILLYGPPGTGKTMLARAVASSSDANFLPVNGPELFDRYVGESERGVREVFDRARANAPSVVFFDELDALAARRNQDGDADATDRVVSQLLTEIDGIEPLDDVVVVGATNRPDMIDRALLRPGRLEKVLEVPLPDREAREAVFEVHTADAPVGDVDLEALAAATEGYTGSDVAAVVREAGLLAVEDYLRRNSFEPDRGTPESLTVRQSHFERAVEAVTPSVTPAMRERYAEMDPTGSSGQDSGGENR